MCCAQSTAHNHLACVSCEVHSTRQFHAAMFACLQRNVVGHVVLLVFVSHFGCAACHPLAHVVPRKMTTSAHCEDTIQWLTWDQAFQIWSRMNGCAPSDVSLERIQRLVFTFERFIKPVATKQFGHGLVVPTRRYKFKVSLLDCKYQLLTPLR